MRSVIGDTGEEQRLVKTLPRKGFRFVGIVQEEPDTAPAEATLPHLRQAIDRRTAVRQHERRSPAGIFC